MQFAGRDNILKKNLLTMAKNAWRLIFPATLIAGIILRIYKIQASYYFTGELGKELLYVRDLISIGKFPLVGMGTSHEWLNYGPIYYWKLIPIVKIFGGSPFILFWFALAVSVAGFFVTYWLFSKIVDRKFSALVVLFCAVSPLWIWASRLSKLHVFFFVIIPLVIYCLYKIWQKDKSKMIWLGFTYGTLFSFHYSQLPMLILFGIVFYLRRKVLTANNYLAFLAGLLLPNITVLIYDAEHGFAMIKNLFLWIPYRLMGFAHLNSRNNLTLDSAKSTLSAFNEFFGKNIFWDERFWILGSAIFLIMYISFVYQNRKKILKDFFVFYLTFSTLIQSLALVVHTTPPLHYFMPIYLNFALLFSHFVLANWNKISVKIMTPAIFILLFVSGVLSLNYEHVRDNDFVPIKVQENVADFIIKDANGTSFDLKRVGPFDFFPETYNQNYKYLILLKGGKVDSQAKTVYTLFERGETVRIRKNE